MLTLCPEPPVAAHLVVKQQLLVDGLVVGGFSGEVQFAILCQTGASRNCTHMAVARGAKSLEPSCTKKFELLH